MFPVRNYEVLSQYFTRTRLPCLVSAVGEPQQLLQTVDLQVQDISCNVPDISAKLRFMMLNEVIDSISR